MVDEATESSAAKPQLWIFRCRKDCLGSILILMRGNMNPKQGQ